MLLRKVYNLDSKEYKSKLRQGVKNNKGTLI